MFLLNLPLLRIHIDCNNDFIWLNFLRNYETARTMEMIDYEIIIMSRCKEFQGALYIA